MDKLRTLWEKAENILKIGRYTNASGADGQLSKVQLKTLRNIEDAFKMGQFGFNSKAPIGSRCVVAEIGNDAIVIANEHIASIIDVESGDSIVYNETGTYIKLIGANIEMSAAENVNIISSSFTHNGVNVGDTHGHTQDPDSAGNTQVKTDPPQ